MKMLLPGGAILLAGLLAPDAVAPRQPESEKSAILEGRIVDELGRPVPGVRVKLYGGFATRWEVGDAVTNDKGVYRFDPAPHGGMIQHTAADGAKVWRNSLGMRIEHPDYCAEDNNGWWDFQIPFDSGTYYRDMRVKLGGTLHGALLDDKGAPAIGLDLRVIGISPLISATANATTDEGGIFRIDHALCPGDYEIQLNDPKADYQSLGRVTIAAGAPTNAQLVRSKVDE